MMKNNLFFPFVLVSLLFGSVYGQEVPKTRYKIAKGSKFITGNLNMGFQGNGNGGFLPSGVNSLSLGIRETNGFFVRDNLAISSLLNYSFSYRRSFEFDDITQEGYFARYYTNKIGPGFALRYYHMFGPRFGIFGQFIAFAEYENRLTRFDHLSGYGVWEGVNIYAGVSPHLVYFFTPRLGMEAGFGNLGFGWTESNSGNSFSGSVQMNPTLNFGLKVLFGKGVQPKD